ncbi:hypothetical protein PFLUV_G00119400 [Perca fluviatilis]|uniref:DDE Tnp4 domain-containing protein n=1 Tax=Perca fluviatilis TaxID=8168 RepID=A0A6A5EQP6_PERFL|nr:hypothetical protein PFLUV_G00119400 [Perca fluviatilis]
MGHHYMQISVANRLNHVTRSVEVFTRSSQYYFHSGKMPVPAVVFPVLWAVIVYLRLMSHQRRHVENRRRIRRLSLVDLFQSDRPATYCRLNVDVPILRLWFDVELNTKQDFRALEVSPTFAPQVIASCAFLHNVCIDNGDVLEPDNDVALDIQDPEPALQEAPEAHETPGNATRDMLAALIYAQATH